MANAISASAAKAHKRLFFVALLMPHTSRLCTFVLIVYHADRKKTTQFSPLPRGSDLTVTLAKKIIANPIQSAGAEGSDNG